MITIENTQECFVQLWLRLERTRRLLQGQRKRYCIRNVLRSWFGLRAYTIAFPRCTPLNVNKKKKQEPP